MLVIYAEKGDVANKIAAALGGFKLPSGTEITFKNLKAQEKAVKKFQRDQGYLDIFFHGVPCKVTWGYGHQYGLKDVFEYDPRLKPWRVRPVCYIPEQFELHPLTSSEANFKRLLDQQRRITAELFKKADRIINATDDDREGELIFAYIYEAVKCRVPYERVHFTDQTEAGIRHAFDSLIPSSKVRNIELAGRARSIYDWLIGTNLTTRMTLKFPGNDVLSIGRVQTPVLKMLADREEAILTFKSEPFWNLKATFTTGKSETYKATYKEEKMRDKAKADKILAEIKGEPGTVTSIVQKNVRKEVPLLYSQSALQIDANRLFGYSSKKTLEISQALYEGGYTTYPRTKSQFLTDEMEPVVVDTLTALSALPQLKSYLDSKPLKPGAKFFNSKKVESHFAIIPTTSVPSSLPPDQQNIYDLICFSLIRTIYPDAMLTKTVVETTVKLYDFTTIGTAIINAGWMAVAHKPKESLIPLLSKGNSVSGAYEVKEGKTEPPKRFDDASLIAAMKSAGKDLEDKELRKILADPKNEGIGTEATRSEIIETLLRRGYVERKGKCFHVTDKGLNLIHNIPVTDMLSPEFTAKMEQKLSSIADGTLDYSMFLDEIMNQTRTWCDAVEHIAAPAAKGAAKKSRYGAPPIEENEEKPKAGKKTATLGECPMCGKKIIRGRFGYYCSGHPGCRFAVNATILSHRMSDANIRALLSKGKTPIIKDFVSKNGKKFEAHLTLDAADGSIKFVFP